MATFPVLKTSAVAQYPARRAAAFRNQTLRFVGGGEQRHRDGAGPLHRWEITLAQLDEDEIARLAEFFAENEGALGNFAFTDPWDGHVYASCSLDSDTMDCAAVEEMSGATSLVVRENRG
jgi:phage-related protein